MSSYSALFGFLNFLKKKEFAEIKRLKKSLKEEKSNSERLKNDIVNLQKEIKKNSVEVETLKNNITKLREEKDRLKYLEKFQPISDIEKEVKRLLDEANQKSQELISKAEKESSEKRAEAIEILKIANKRKLDIAKRAETSLNEAKQKTDEINQQAVKIIEDAGVQAKIIIEKAEEQAQKIAGDAYEALKKSESLEKTIKALENKVKGYGDEYIVPTYSLLDELADDFGHREAGQNLQQARERSRLMIKNHLAAKCEYVEDNRRESAINFVIDAFNGKVDTILSSVRHDNFGKLKQKIEDAYYLVNNLGSAFRSAIITEQYRDARIDELKWAVITVELKNAEREEQKRIKEQIREEERAKKEFERALKNAEKEEMLLKKAMEKAKKQIESATEQQRLKYEKQLEELTEKLKVAEEKGQRAMSMAQKTKSGHVYIISNIGSFGENVYKIGMTRRLEPTDRVKELGDASVPFPFDIHAMIYSEDAPALENELHKNFVYGQVNKVNSRKEFFRVNLTEIKDKIKELNLAVKWTMLAEATEYRETLAIEKKIQLNKSIKDDWLQRQIGAKNL